MWELEIFAANNQKIAEIVADGIVVNDANEALDVMVNAGYYGARRMIWYEKHLNPEFFNLRSGLAGEILQKFANYQMTLAIVGEFEKFKSSSLRAFIVESNRGNLVFFVPDKETAIFKLVK